MILLFDFTIEVVYINSQNLRKNMTMKKYSLSIFPICFLIALVISSCSKASQQIAEPAIPTSQPVLETLRVEAPPPQTDISTSVPPTATDVPQRQLATFQDPVYGFTFDYPAEWVVDQISFGSRAPASYQLSSWDHEPGLVDNVPAGETIVNITIQLWDPKNDLPGFIESRLMGWEASGFAINNTQDLLLQNGSSARAYIVTTPDGSAGYFLFSTMGEDYLVASGNGDLELIDLVARSLR